MQSSVTRLLVALFGPPILGSVLLHVTELIVDVLSGAGKYRAPSDFLASLGAFAAYGFAFCLLPGLGLWVTTEYLVKRRRSRSAHLLACVVFGLIAGVAIPLVLFGRNQSAILVWTAVGIVVAAIISQLLWVINPQTR